MRINQKNPVIALAIALIASFTLIYPTNAAVAWTTQTVDSTLGVGIYNSIALDSHGYPCISYYDGFNYDLKYAHYNGQAGASRPLTGQARARLFP